MKFHNALTDAAVKNAKPQAKDYKLSDGGGLYLLVTSKGGKYWRYKYRIDGVEKKGSLGAFPEVTLKQARQKHDAARGHVAEGNDPVAERRKAEQKQEAVRLADRPFREFAQAWLTEMRPAERFAKRTRVRDARLVGTLSNSPMGKLPWSQIEVRHLADLLSTYERAGKFETRRRLQETAFAIGGFCVGRGFIKRNPFRDVEFAASFTSPEATRTNRPAVVEADKFAILVRDIERTKMADIIKHSLRLLTLTMLRPGELAVAEWGHVKWNEHKLVVPFQSLKMRTQRKAAKSDRAGKDFEVPLSRQAIAELRALRKLTGDTPYLFPARHGKNKAKTMKEFAFNAALIRMGYQGIHCAHGFRSSASTLLNAERVVIEGHETLRWPDQKALIEVQLDHNDASTQAVYDRGGRWKERAELMQLWGDRVEKMRNGGATLVLAAA